MTQNKLQSHKGMSDSGSKTWDVGDWLIVFDDKSLQVIDQIQEHEFNCSR